jgi:hypothetical protein
MTSDLVSRANLAQRRDLALAPRLCIGTARMEGAAWWRIDRARNVTLQQLFLALDTWIVNWKCG